MQTPSKCWIGIIESRMTNTEKFKEWRQIYNPVYHRNGKGVKWFRLQPLIKLAKEKLDSYNEWKRDHKSKFYTEYRVVIKEYELIEFAHTERIIE